MLVLSRKLGEKIIIGDNIVGDPVAVEKAAQPGADRIHAGLVIAAAVGVHQRFEQRQHGRPLRGEPIEHRAFLWSHTESG